MPRVAKGKPKPGAREPNICRILELLAFAIHPGDTQSTTTIGLSCGQNRMFVTSQGNTEYSTNPLDYTDILDSILKLQAAMRRKDGDTKEGKPRLTLDDASEEFWTGRCDLSGKPDPKGKIAVIKEKLFEPLFKDVVRQPPATINLVKSTIGLVRCVQNKHLFTGTVPALTGFHGESRVIRYLYIGFVQSKPATASAEQVGGWFDAWMPLQELYMGSSQGTCSGCCKCLDAFGIRRGATGNTPKQWIGPLAMKGTQGSTVIDSGPYNHAFVHARKTGEDAIAALDLDRAFEDDEDVW